MNKLKKFFTAAAMISLGVISTCILPYLADSGGLSVSAMASGTPPPRTMSIEFMGRGANPQDTNAGSANLTAEDITATDVKGEFWIGLAVDKVNDLNLFKQGIYSLEVAFEYDPQFVVPFTDDVYTTWQEALEHGNLMNPVFNNSAWWDSNNYTIKAVPSTDLDLETDRENLSLATTRESQGWKMCTVCVTLDMSKTTATGDKRFTGLSVPDKQYLLKLPFKLVKAPAEGQNPKVISLVRGPETLDIGSSSDGTEPYSAWEATVDDWNDETNMKTLFTFGGDISLFGEDTNAIKDIIAHQYIDSSVTPKPTLEPSATLQPEATPGVYTLSSTKDLTKDGFNPETLEYYINVPNETDKMTLEIKSSESPVVEANDVSVQANSTSDETYTTDAFALNEANRDVSNGGEIDGYNNKITVEANGITYTIYVRRLCNVRIEFKPGNSPYGLIERMKDDSNDPWNDDKIQQAKEAFNSDSRNKQYGKNLVPKYGNGTLYYTTDAWQVKEGNKFVDGTNYDLDSSAIFVHQLVKFKDPGFVIYDQTNQEVTNPTITAKILKVIVQKSSGIPKYDPNAVGEDVVATQNATTKELEYDFSKTMVEPNKYEIEYTYTYTDVNDGTSKTFTAKRPVILGAKRGDIVLSKPSVVNVNDASNMASKYGSFSTLNKYYAFRVADVQQSKPPVVNVNDNSTMRSKYGAGFSQFYDDSMLK